MRKFVFRILATAMLLTSIPLMQPLVTEAATATTYTSLPADYVTVGGWSDWIEVASETALPADLDPNKEYMIERRVDLCVHSNGWDIGGGTFYKQFNPLGYIQIKEYNSEWNHESTNVGQLSWNIPGQYMYDGMDWSVSFGPLDCPYGYGSSDEWYNIRFFRVTISNERCEDYEKNNKWMPYFGYNHRCSYLGTAVDWENPASYYWVTTRYGNREMHDCDQATWCPPNYGNRLYPGTRDNWACMYPDDGLITSQAHNWQYVNDYILKYGEDAPHKCQFGLYGWDKSHEFHDVRYIEVRPKAWYAAYDANGGTGSIPTDEIKIGANYTLSNGSAFTRDGHKLDGWSSTPTGGIDYNLSQVVKDLAGPGQTKTFYAHWKPMWKLTIDYAKPPKSSNPIDGTGGTLYKWYETNVDKIGKNVTLPAPTIRGWTFLGYRIDSVTVSNDTLWSWSADKTAIGQWKENKYNVRYNDCMGGTPVIQPNIPYEDPAKVYTQVETKFTKVGYYLDGWSLKPNVQTPVYKVPVDPAIEPNRTTTDSFQKLTDKDGDTVDLYAVWKPMPYVVRIYDNYKGGTGTCSNKSKHDTCSFHKDFIVYYDSEFTFPPALWNHGNATVMGYDKQPDVYVNPTYRVGDTVSNPTTNPMQIIEYFTIWDSPPEIQSPSEINFNYEKANSFGINVSNGTVSQSELEAWLLAQATAYDYEWSQRHTGPIPVGNNDGYSLRIESFTPDIVSGSATAETPLSYTVTFAVTDDAGNSATSITKLFLGDAIDILIQTY